jgi:hypothetical protein
MPGRPTAEGGRALGPVPPAQARLGRRMAAPQRLVPAPEILSIVKTRLIGAPAPRRLRHHSHPSASFR